MPIHVDTILARRITDRVGDLFEGGYLDVENEAGVQLVRFEFGPGTFIRDGATGIRLGSPVVAVGVRDGDATSFRLVTKRGTEVRGTTGDPGDEADLIIRNELPEPTDYVYKNARITLEHVALQVANLRRAVTSPLLALIAVPLVGERTATVVEPIYFDDRAEITTDTGLPQPYGLHDPRLFDARREEHVRLQGGDHFEDHRLIDGSPVESVVDTYPENRIRFDEPSRSTDAAQVRSSQRSTEEPARLTSPEQVRASQANTVTFNAEARGDNFTTFALPSGTLLVTGVDPVATLQVQGQPFVVGDATGADITASTADPSADVQMTTPVFLVGDEVGRDASATGDDPVASAAVQAPFTVGDALGTDIVVGTIDPAADARIRSGFTVPGASFAATGVDPVAGVEAFTQPFVVPRPQVTAGGVKPVASASAGASLVVPPASLEATGTDPVASSDVSAAFGVGAADVEVAGADRVGTSAADGDFALPGTIESGATATDPVASGSAGAPFQMPGVDASADTFDYEPYAATGPVVVAYADNQQYRETYTLSGGRGAVQDAQALAPPLGFTIEYPGSAGSLSVDIVYQSYYLDSASDFFVRVISESGNSQTVSQDSLVDVSYGNRAGVVASPGSGTLTESEGTAARTRTFTLTDPDDDIFEVTLQDSNPSAYASRFTQVVDRTDGRNDILVSRTDAPGTTVIAVPQNRPGFPRRQVDVSIRFDGPYATQNSTVTLSFRSTQPDNGRIYTVTDGNPPTFFYDVGVSEYDAAPPTNARVHNDGITRFEQVNFQNGTGGVQNVQVIAGQGWSLLEFPLGGNDFEAARLNYDGVGDGTYLSQSVTLRLTSEAGTYDRVVSYPVGNFTGTISGNDVTVQEGQTAQLVFNFDGQDDDIHEVFVRDSSNDAGGNYTTRSVRVYNASNQLLASDSGGFDVDLTIPIPSAGTRTGRVEVDLTNMVDTDSPGFVDYRCLVTAYFGAFSSQVAGGSGRTSAISDSSGVTVDEPAPSPYTTQGPFDPPFTDTGSSQLVASYNIFGGDPPLLDVYLTGDTAGFSVVFNDTPGSEGADIYYDGVTGPFADRNLDMKVVNNGGTHTRRVDPAYVPVAFVNVVPTSQSFTVTPGVTPSGIIGTYDASDTSDPITVGTFLDSSPGITVTFSGPDSTTVEIRYDGSGGTAGTSDSFTLEVRNAGGATDTVTGNVTYEQPPAPVGWESPNTTTITDTNGTDSEAQSTRQRVFPSAGARITRMSISTSSGYAKNIDFEVRNHNATIIYRVTDTTHDYNIPVGESEVDQLVRYRAQFTQISPGDSFVVSVLAQDSNGNTYTDNYSVTVS